MICLVWYGLVALVGVVGRGDRCCGGVEPATAGGGEWAGDSGAANGGGAGGGGSAVAGVGGCSG